MWCSNLLSLPPPASHRVSSRLNILPVLPATVQHLQYPGYLTGGSINFDNTCINTCYVSIVQSGCQLKDHSVLGMNKESSPLHSQSEHHFSKTFSDSVSIRQKSAPPTSSGISSMKQNQTKTVYNVLNAYRDVICVGGLQTDYTSKVYSGNSDISIFQQERERVACPRSRPSTTNTVSSDTNCLSRETSQSSVRNTHRSQRSRNSRMRHYNQQESISDVEEDEIGKEMCCLI